MRLNQLEEQALAEKPWQQKGEVSASTRPHNSLLEEMVEFDLTTRAGEKVRGTDPGKAAEMCSFGLLLSYTFEEENVMYFTEFLDYLSFNNSMMVPCCHVLAQ